MSRSRSLALAAGDQPYTWLADAVIDIARLITDRPIHGVAHQWIRQKLTASHMQEHPLMVACTARGYSSLRLQQQRRRRNLDRVLSWRHYKQAGTILDVNAIIANTCLAGAGVPCDFSFSRALVIAAVTRSLDADARPSPGAFDAGVCWNTTAQIALNVLTSMQSLSNFILGVMDLPESARQDRLLLSASAAGRIDFSVLRDWSNSHTRIAERAAASVSIAELRACARDTQAGLLAIAQMLWHNRVPITTDDGSIDRRSLRM